MTIRQGPLAGSSWEPASADASAAFWIARRLAISVDPSTTSATIGEQQRQRKRDQHERLPVLIFRSPIDRPTASSGPFPYP